MGISTEVFTVYGWKCDAKNSAFIDWMEEVDYDYPEGIIFDGMGGNYVVLGFKLFESGDARWEPMEGFESFTLNYAQDKLEEYLYQLEYDCGGLYTKFQVMLPELKSAPKFHTFVYYS